MSQILFWVFYIYYLILTITLAKQDSCYAYYKDEEIEDESG